MIYAVIIALFMIVGAVTVAMTRRHGPRAMQKLEQSNQPIVHREDMSCTCTEWRSLRAQFNVNDPRRLCVHCCAFLEKDIMRVPEKLLPFLQLIHHMVTQERGIPCAQPSFAFILGENGYVVLLPTGNEHDATIYFADQEYVLDVFTGEWGQTRPPFAGEIASLVRSEMRRSH